MEVPQYPQLKSAEAVRVLALRKVVEGYGDQEDLWAIVKSAGVAASGPCFTNFFDMCFKEKDMDLEVCLPVADDAVVPDTLPECVRVRRLPAWPRVAAVTHFGSLSQTYGTYSDFMKWVEEEKLRPVGPFREVYLSKDPTDVSEASFVTEIQLVVE